MRRPTVAPPGSHRDEQRSVESSDTRTSAARAVARERERAAALAAVVEDLGAELSLRPLLERILERSVTLLGGDAGSICLVDEAAGLYRKEADIGVACQSGRVFPLDRGRHRRGGQGARVGGLRRLRAGARAGTCPRPTARRCAGSSASRSGGAPPSSDRASCSAATRCARSRTRTRRCWRTSPSTPRWPSPTRACTRPRTRTRGPRPRPRSATAWPARCTTPWPRASSRCSCTCARPRPAWRRDTSPSSGWP